MRKVLLFFSLFLSLNVIPLFAQSIYYTRTGFGLTSPGAMRFGQYGYDNPALLSTLTGPDFSLQWTSFNQGWSNKRLLNAQLAFPGFSFGYTNERLAGKSASEYNVASGFGDDGYSFGLGYSWSNGASSLIRPSVWSFGLMMRPNVYLSTGLMFYSPDKGMSESVAEVAVRPFKNELLALFGDYVYKEEYAANESKWSAGIAVEAYPGVRLTGRFFDNKTATAGIQIGLGTLGLTSQSYFDKHSKHQYNSYGVRMGTFDRNIFSRMGITKKYYQVNLNKGLDYTKYKWFDNKYTLMELLTNLEAVKTDPAVKGVLINTMGMYANRELVWEIREKLKEVKEAGKEVIVYLDRAGIDYYHFASVADKIIMDPLGSVSLEGYLMGRTYFKGTLQKLGIGYDEMRFFKYKSAVETFSRDKMSEGDREQRQKITDDWYRLAKDDIVSSGRITAEKFDTLVNSQLIYFGKDALKHKLVDSLVRWDVLQEQLQNSGTVMVGGEDLLANKLPEDNRWGKKPVVAVIYALGACDMETGIAARKLINDVKSAVNNPNVKAIVLRVDSPGGDALAADYIADVLRRAKGKKPIIVSQGFVAGSGGYWLSMYSDTIVAAPSTITGSIGVIGGFFYDAGLKNTLGITTDFVKKGDNADAGFGFTIPLIGLPLMDKPLTTEQRAQVEGTIRTLYADFVDKVAEGRNKKPEAIAEIAQGRVWSGYDGLKIGLVDVLGGIEKAIAIASAKANLKKGEYDIWQMPDAPLFDVSMFMPKLISVPVRIEDPAIQNLKYRMENNGKPLYMVPIDLDVQK